jgi:hypothetical protein
MFWHYFQGKKTSIRTRVSHGEAEFDGAMLAQRRRQMGGLTRSQMFDFIECPMSAADYKSHPIGEGRILLE